MKSHSFFKVVMVGALLGFCAPMMADTHDKEISMGQCSRDGSAPKQEDSGNCNKGGCDSGCGNGGCCNGEQSDATSQVQQTRKSAAKKVLEGG